MKIGIDASNIIRGGGVTHLSELLAAANPPEHGIKKVFVWSNSKTLNLLVSRPWLQKCGGGLLEKGILHRLVWQRFILPIIARNVCDVLFVPGGNVPGKFRPYVAMSQNLLPFDEKERRNYGLSLMGIRLALLRRGQARTFRKAAAVIFLTRTAQKIVERETGILSNSIIIPHGVSNRFRMRPRLQRQINEIRHDRPFRWLYVSIIDHYKHQWQVARAVDMLRSRGMPVILDLVGPAYPAAYERFLLEIDSLPFPEEIVRYHGEVAHAELSSFYKDADGFVFGSSCENMPNILIEAMAAGLPIACSNRGPMPDVLGDAGVYFDPESPDQIAGAMASLMYDPKKRAANATRAFERAGQYTWDRCASETFSFLAKIGGHNSKLGVEQ